MKQSTLTTKIMTAVLVLGVLAYLAVYAVQGWTAQLQTALAYSAQVNVGVEASGIVVREEQVITGGSGYVDLVPNEGERVAAGGAVAILYQDASGLDTRQEIRTINAEIDQLSYALSSGTDGVDTAKLDSAVLQSIVNLRSLAAGDDLSTLEDSALNLRTMVFKRDYTYGDGGEAASIAAIIGEKRARLEQLQSELSRVATTVYAPRSGVFSGVADGYEGLLDPETVRAMTPSQLKALLEGKVSAPAGAVGKLITSSAWYFAAVLSGEDARQLSEGQSYLIAFSNDWFGQVDMTLEWLSDKEDGEQIALFSARTELADTTLLRRQTVDIVSRQLSGIRIPRKALRVITETVTDKDTGESRQVQYTGVYTVVGTQAELQRVNILYTDENFYLVEPVDAASARRLRAGDEVILNTSGIYDGKVVR